MAQYEGKWTPERDANGKTDKEEQDADEEEQDTCSEADAQSEIESAYGKQPIKASSTENRDSASSESSIMNLAAYYGRNYRTPNHALPQTSHFPSSPGEPTRSSTPKRHDNRTRSRNSSDSNSSEDSVSDLSLSDDDSTPNTSLGSSTAASSHTSLPLSCSDSQSPSPSRSSASSASLSSSSSSSGDETVSRRHRPSQKTTQSKKKDGKYADKKVSNTKPPRVLLPRDYSWPTSPSPLPKASRPSKHSKLESSKKDIQEATSSQKTKPDTSARDDKPQTFRADPKPRYDRSHPIVEKYYGRRYKSETKPSFCLNDSSLEGGVERVSDYIHGHLSLKTQEKLRDKMDNPPQVKGYIYAYEITNNSTPHHCYIKVGCLIDPPGRINEWKRCGDKIKLVGIWPRSNNPKDRIRNWNTSAKPISNHAFAERLIHIELQDLVAHSKDVEGSKDQAQDRSKIGCEGCE